MYAMDHKKIKKEAINRSISELGKSNTGLLDQIIAIQTSHDRFSTSYSISKSSKNLINILVECEKQCAKPLIQTNIQSFSANLSTNNSKNISQKISQNYHIHGIADNHDLTRCLISFHIPIVLYFELMSHTSTMEMRINLKRVGWSNFISNLLPLSGPVMNHDNFSVKSGLRNAWIKRNLIINSIHTDFESYSDEKLKLFNKSDELIEIIRIQKSPKAADLQDLELLSILEELLYHRIIASYNLEIFENTSIILVKLDLDQEDKMMKNEISGVHREMIVNLTFASNVILVLLANQ